MLLLFAWVFRWYLLKPMQIQANCHTDILKPMQIATTLWKSLKTHAPAREPMGTHRATTTTQQTAWSKRCPPLRNPLVSASLDLPVTGGSDKPDELPLNLRFNLLHKKGGGRIQVGMPYKLLFRSGGGIPTFLLKVEVACSLLICLFRYRLHRLLSQLK